MQIDFKTGMVADRLRKRMESIQPAFDTQVLKDSNYFAPMDTGNLKASGVTGSQIGSGILVWNTPYAKKMYYGVGYNFSKDSNPNARAKWFEEAKAQHLKSWEGMANRAYNR